MTDDDKYTEPSGGIGKTDSSDIGSDGSLSYDVGPVGNYVDDGEAHNKDLEGDIWDDIDGNMDGIGNHDESLNDIGNEFPAEERHLFHDRVEEEKEPDIENKDNGSGDFSIDGPSFFDEKNLSKVEQANNNNEFEETLNLLSDDLNSSTINDQKEELSCTASNNEASKVIVTSVRGEETKMNDDELSPKMNSSGDVKTSEEILKVETCEDANVSPLASVQSTNGDDESSNMNNNNIIVTSTDDAVKESMKEDNNSDPVSFQNEGKKRSDDEGDDAAMNKSVKEVAKMIDEKQQASTDVTNKIGEKKVPWWTSQQNDDSISEKEDSDVTPPVPAKNRVVRGRWWIENAVESSGVNDTENQENSKKGNDSEESQFGDNKNTISTQRETIHVNSNAIGKEKEIPKSNEKCWWTQKEGGKEESIEIFDPPKENVAPGTSPSKESEREGEIIEGHHQSRSLDTEFEQTLSLTPTNNNTQQNWEKEKEAPVVIEELKVRRPVEFRNPYPFRPPQLQLRPPESIIKDHSKPKKEFVPNLIAPTKAHLRDLILAAKDPSFARRSNACGAIKVLASLKKNQKMLAHSTGLLDSIVFAADVSPHVEDPEAALVARTRATTVLHLLSHPKENRRLLLEQQGLLECLVKVMNEDSGEARVQACSTIAMLAKTEENRDTLVQTKFLVSSLAKVVRGVCDENGVLIDGLIVNTNNELLLNGDANGQRQGGNGEAVDDESSLDSSTLHNDGSMISQDSTLSASSSEESEPIENNGAPLETTNAHKNVDTAQSSDSVPPINNDTNPSFASNNKAALRKVNADKFEDLLASARLNACAALLHLSKHCPVSMDLCNNETFLSNLIIVSQEMDKQIHTRCLEIICNLTRFPKNNARLARRSMLIDALLKCGKSKLVEDRIWSMRTLQNLTSDPSSKTILATTPMLQMLCVSAMRSGTEQDSALRAIFNLSTEPGAIVPLTNTKNVIATLVHLAHSPESSAENCHVACDALATIGLWLQTLAGAGSVPEGIDPIPLPSHVSTGWMRWN